MSPFYATHAGMLSYVARAFAELSQSGDAANAKRLAIYASILERMVDELTAAVPSEAPRGRA
ncbi:MAG: hypothetical protein WDO24_08835 [Pseudomonadota bacterium]